VASVEKVNAVVFLTDYH